MKRNNIILGAVGIIATAAVFVVSPWNSDNSTSLYTQETLSALTPQSADDAQLWMEARYIDHETGERISDKKLSQIDAAMKLMPNSRALSFIEQGPDNIGGRTRAIQVDKLNSNVIWAGSVSGGLYKSTNQADYWEPVPGYEVLGSPYISSMCQFTNGTLFVATGSNDESWSGDGVWYTQDQGVSWTSVPGTSGLSTVNEVVAPENGTTLWLTTTSGLRKWNFGDASLTTVSVAAGGCNSLQCSDNGSVFVCAMASNKTYVSTDGGTTWTDHSGTGSTQVPQGGSRIEYAISKGLNSSGMYSLYAVRTSSNLNGMNVSHDNGTTWSEFVGASGSPSNLDIYRNQGGYNTIVSVTPSNPEKILIGGIDIWKWEQTTSTPVAGGFEKLTEWFLSPTSAKYAHADNHEMKWSGNRMYLGNDGGIGVTNDPEVSWYPANRGYNVTQFYGIAFDRHGSVMGGAQDNGTNYNDHSLSTWLEFREIMGGDGFDCDISFFNPNVLFATSQFGFVARSGDAGQTMNGFMPPFPATYTEANQPFHTKIWLAEYYDTNSEDSVTFVPNQPYPAGADIQIPSLASGDSILYTTPVPLYYDDTLNYNPGLSVTETSCVNALTGQIVYLDLYPWVHHGTSGSGLNPPLPGDSLIVTFPTGPDTVIVLTTGTFTHYYAQNPATLEIRDLGIDSVQYGVAWSFVTVQDPYQSWFLMFVNANGGELWGTRNALRFSVSDQQWGRIAIGIGGGSFNSVDCEFTSDLSSLYISTGSSTMRRIDGLGSVYTSDPDFETKVFHDLTLPAIPTATSMLSFSPGSTVQGIAVNPMDNDDVVTFNGFGACRRSSNATSGAPTFTSLASIGGASPASYDGIIDRLNPNIIVVGTSHGAYVTEDGGVTWSDASSGFSGTPVYEVRQSWRAWGQGNFRPGEIYIGTFGRGIWSSASYLGTADGESSGGIINAGSFATNLISYPNPTSSSSTLSFELEKTSDVSVQVYSLSGRLIKEVNQKGMAKGSQILSLGAEDFAIGTYIVKFSAGSQKATTKFIKR
ncbi:MAG: hypothetical protein ACI837_000951 [Crocinitomicaceae bacterium]|jgi:hypothetical protein